MIKSIRNIALVAVFLISSANIFAQHKKSEYKNDGISEYQRPPKLQAYLDKIDPADMKYMFASDEDMKWWKEAKFGVFVHWAPAVVNEAPLSWGRAGRKPHHKKDNQTKGVPEQEYNDTYKTFNPDKFSADEWVKLWKEAGAKYFVFTTKHHYGFCMWDTKTTDFNIMHTPYGKDVVKEIADACHKYDMRLLWYYSQPDWTNELYRQPLPSKEFNEKILYPQLTELMNNYGKIDGIWFDGLGKSPDTWDAVKLMKIIKTANPHAIVNHRFGSPDMHMGDFDGPERGIGPFQINRPWETCEVIGGGWGYMGEKKAMPYSDVIQLLTRIAGNGGNLLLDTGPRADGSIIESHKKRYKQIGQYLKKYGESIYATQGGPYITGAWGTSTYKGEKVWLHVLGEIQNNNFTLPQLPAKIKSYKVLTGGKVTVKNGKNGLKVTLDDEATKPVVTIIELTLDKDASTIAPIKTLGEPIFFDAKLVSSSDKSKTFSARNLMPGAKASFSEGIHVKKSWYPSKDDKTPSLTYTWDKPQQISQITIQEGRRIGNNHAVKSFEIKYKVNGKWKTLYKGKGIGPFFNLMLDKPIKADVLKIQINELKGTLEINKVGIYK